MNYWLECIRDAFDEAGITSTPEQEKMVAEAVAGAHENFDLHMGHECIPNPLKQENERLEKELQRERDKIQCRECKGEGRLYSSYGTRSSNTECWKCRGQGKVLP